MLYDSISNAGSYRFIGRIGADYKVHGLEAISSTSAVPGESPFIIRATAIGMEPVAQRYIGIANTSTMSMLSRELSENRVMSLIMEL